MNSPESSTPESRQKLGCFLLPLFFLFAAGIVTETYGLLYVSALGITPATVVMLRETLSRFNQET